VRAIVRFAFVVAIAGCFGVAIFAGPSCSASNEALDYAKLCRETCSTAGGVKFNEWSKCECHPRPASADAGPAERR
jgi:hypothetical protein